MEGGVSAARGYGSPLSSVDPDCSSDPPTGAAGGPRSISEGQVTPSLPHQPPDGLRLILVHFQEG